MKWIWILLLGLLLASSAQQNGMSNLTAAEIGRRINYMFDVPECAWLPAKLDLLNAEAARWSWVAARVTAVANQYRADCRAAIKTKADRAKLERQNAPTRLRLPNEQKQIVEMIMPARPADPATETP